MNKDDMRALVREELRALLRQELPGLLTELHQDGFLSVPLAESKLSYRGCLDPSMESNAIIRDEDIFEVPLQPSSEHKWQNGEWTRVAQTPPTPEELRAYNAGKRWHVETAGFSFNGMKIATDDRSKLMITGARIKADNDPTFETNWKATDGSFISLNATMIIAISDAVLAHVDACFTQEQAVKDGIDSGYIANIEDIDAVWELMP